MNEKLYKKFFELYVNNKIIMGSIDDVSEDQVCKAEERLNILEDDIDQLISDDDGAIEISNEIVEKLLSDK